KRAEVYEHWLVVARDDDFIGVQNYERSIYGPDGEVHPGPDDVVNEQGTVVEPDSLRGAVEYVYSIAQVPVIVTEHGISTADDTVRVSFIEPALDGLAQAIRNGVPVVGYFHWTLLDNFEWIFGYTQRIGLDDGSLLVDDVVGAGMHLSVGPVDGA
ncbi:family 1 glycosylhydrolase, partial [Rhizobium johnstonii]|uniref:family 1 glycosylhydrolase n=1 Tax=Rhizobium johnstonii TaxID=3019933 RepID=UPI003F9977F3